MKKLDKNLKTTPERTDGKGVLARIDSHCGYCKKEIKSNYKSCPHCGAALLLDVEYDEMGSFAREYYLDHINRKMIT